MTDRLYEASRTAACFLLAGLLLTVFVDTRILFGAVFLAAAVLGAWCFVRGKVREDDYGI